MRKYRLITVAMLGLALAAPALAESRDPFAEFDARLRDLDPKRWLGRAVSEADVERLFAWMRASLLAAMEGRQPPPPPDKLRQRAESLSRELAAQGALTGLALLDALEEYARRAVREKPVRPLPGSI